MAISILRQTLLRRTALAGAVGALLMANTARARTLEFDLPPQPLAQSLDAYARIVGQQVIYSADAVDGKSAPPLHGKYSPEVALADLVTGSGLSVTRTASGDAMVEAPPPVRLAQVTPRRPQAPPSGIETIVVTAEKKSEDIQMVPIAVSAFTQKQLTERQVATGGDLIRETPNMNFGKTNFSGYSIELRGIGTQAISVTTDPAVAVAFNGIPFLRNHFFEQEFFDLENVQILRGPQGTLYGRNATAGVVNLVSAKPTGEFDAIASVDLGNYNNRRIEAMINIPIVGDKLDLRIAGEWTKRDGYSFNQLTNNSIDGRDLWSSRASLALRPSADLQFELVWEHYSESDDRMRTAKQLCHTSPVPTEIAGVPVSLPTNGAFSAGDYLTQGCQMSSLYTADAFQVPNGFSLPYFAPLSSLNVPVNPVIDPYASTVQSRNLRHIESSLNPVYKAKNDIVELNVDYDVTPNVTITSQSGYNRDVLWSTEDYNRFNSSPGAFVSPANFASGIVVADPLAGTRGVPSNATIFCDPQLGCSDRLVAQDISDEHSWQASEELRLTSNFDGPFNFSVGSNLLHYETEENYFVFINSLTLASAYEPLGVSGTWVPGVSDNRGCIEAHGGFTYSKPGFAVGAPIACVYIDPNPIGSLNNQGHNYFLSQNPYVLNSYAVFGEANYKVTDSLKLTTGLRWTDDQKHFNDIPSELLVNGFGYPLTRVVNQTWGQWSGRLVADWTPSLDFTDQTLFYASYSHGYKAGGANPPGAVFINAGALGEVSNPIHPLTFKPEHIEAVELGTKNTLLDDALTLNADVFYYNYHGYQISEIVDRSAINLNFNAHVEGAEVESTWEPLPGLRFNLAAGWENTTLAKGSQAVDLIDRTAGNRNWLVVKPFPTQTSNCILPVSLVLFQVLRSEGASIANDCTSAYGAGLDPVTRQPYVPNPTVDADGQPIAPGTYPGFNPLTAPNGGQGFDKNLSGNQLPNAPPFTLSMGAQYSMPVWQDWAATLRGDVYWQGNSWARVFNDKPYDQLHGYTNLNLALILNSTDGWQVMGYVKNVFNTTAITGDFLNSDDSGLTTNVFLTDPRLFGIRVTKDFAEGASGGYGVPEFFDDLFSDVDHGKPSVWIALGGGIEVVTGLGAPLDKPFMHALVQDGFSSPMNLQRALSQDFSAEAAVSFQPEGSDWILSGSIRFGRAGATKAVHQQTNNTFKFVVGTQTVFITPSGPGAGLVRGRKFEDVQSHNSETHAIVDFVAGTDVGLGRLSPAGESIVNFGVRYVQFTSQQNLALHADPDFNLPTNIKYPETHHTYAVGSHIDRSFHGIGPAISWKGSLPLIGDPEGGEVDFDMGANGALLFGRQKVRAHHRTTSTYFASQYLGVGGRLTSTAHATADIHRTKSVVAPNAGILAGLSYRYTNAEVSFGYRTDFFFHAMDGGVDRYRATDRSFSGPFAKISIGLGG